MTGLPGRDVAAELAALDAHFVTGEALGVSDWTKPAPPLNPAEFAALIERAVRNLFNAPPRWHGTPQNPHITWPGGNICGECGADVAALAAADAAHARKKAAEHAWEVSLRFLTAEERDRAEWERSVRERLDEALLHLANGLDATWDRLPCAKYPACVPGPEASW